MKKLRWNRKARSFVKLLDISSKRELGSLLMLLQTGRMLTQPQSKPMKRIHKNAHELRLKDQRGVYRVIYVLNIGNEIYIPHAFTKKTNKTENKEINLAVKRLQELLDENK